MTLDQNSQQKLIGFNLLKQKGLKNVFDEAIVAALTPPVEKGKKKCRVL